MKKTVFLILALLAFQGIHAQGRERNNQGRCKVEVNDVSKVASWGYLITYIVQFKNNTNKTVDGLYWTVYFYNNNGDLIKSEEESFNSDNIIDPIGSGMTKSITRTPRVKGASKAIITLNKVHFSDGTKCD